MNEDLELNAFIKGKLEEGVPATPACIGEIARRAALEARPAAVRRISWRPWAWAPALVAASLAIAFLWVDVTSARAAAANATVGEVLDLLAEDGSFETETFLALSTEEKLLVWQDAPFETAFSEVYSEN